MKQPPAPDIAALAAVVESARALAEVAWDQVAPVDLLAAASGLARARAGIDGALVEVADRLVVTDAPTLAGWASTKDFLTHCLGGRKGTGATLTRVAEQTRDLPPVRAAMRVGTVSLAQASVIGQRINQLPRVPQFQQAVADRLLDHAVAGGLDATDLERATPELVAELDRDGAVVGHDLTLDRAERGAHRARFLSIAPDQFGGARIRGYGTLEDAELIRTTLMPLAAPLTTAPGACGGAPELSAAQRHEARLAGVATGCPDPACAHDGKDPREHGARMFDALLEACHCLQATDTLPQSHGTTARITVTLGYDQLTTRLADTTANPHRAGRLDSGEPLSAAAVRRLACDAEIIPAVLGTDSQILDVGRTQRLVTTGLWNALVLRDRHCIFPGCQRLPIACDAHHLTHWADGGSTSLDNLVLLCRRHHTITHHTPWHVSLDPHTRRPVWTPPPATDDASRFTYHPARHPPPHAA